MFADQDTSTWKQQQLVCYTFKVYCSFCTPKLFQFLSTENPQWLHQTTNIKCTPFVFQYTVKYDKSPKNFPARYPEH